MILYSLIAFLIGSIPVGLIVSKIFGVQNLRTAGSGNIGATNVSRVVGFWPAGFITFVLDFAKGAALPLFCKLFGQFDAFELWTLGLCSVGGHCFSPWLRFKGGKGVATGLGVVFVLSPFSAFFGALFFAFVFLQYRISSLASLAGLMVATITYLILDPIEKQSWIAGALVLLILIRHEVNIDALLQNKERGFK